MCAKGGHAAMSERHTVLTFESTHAAMTAQKLLKDHLHFIVIPVPRQLSASCGLALRLSADDKDRALALTAEGGLDDRSMQVHDLGDEQ